jgi:hypothetical protein
MWSMSNGTTDQKVERILTEMIGLDGKSGMKHNIEVIKDDGVNGRRKLHEKIDHLETCMMTKQECEKIRLEPVKKRTEVVKLRLAEAGVIGAIISIVLGILKALGWL